MLLVKMKVTDKTFVQAGISGGGNLPSHVDKFFEVGFLLLYTCQV